MDAASFNGYLDTLKPGLTAKVIRTAIASATFEEHLRDDDDDDDGKRDAKSVFSDASLATAAWVNHRRAGKDCPRDVRIDVVMSDGRTRRADLRRCWGQSTTLTNYVDPRIIVAFCKRRGIGVDRVGLSAGLRARFQWAMDVPAGYRFVALKKKGAATNPLVKF